MRPIVPVAVGYVLLTRLAELLLSRHNARRVLGRGGRLVARDGIGALAAVHVMLIVAMPLEDALLGPHLPLVARAVAIGLFTLAELLRFWAIATLGERWNVRVIVVDGAERIRRGPFRFLRHPNYVGATIGVAALPLALGLPVTAVALTVAKVVAVRRRIALEDAALDRAAGAAGTGGPAPVGSAP